MTMADIKEIVRLSIQGDSTINERKQILMKHRTKMEEQLKELQLSIDKVDKKIAFYNGASEC